MLRGQRLILRAIRRSDIPFFLKWYNDPEVTQFVTLYLPITEMQEERWIEELILKRQGQDIVLVIEVTENNNPIGTCGLHKINHKDRNAEITFIIGEKEVWKQGYGTEAAKILIEYAFNQLNLIRLSTGAYSFNTRSIQHLERLGFQKEGCQRKAVFKNGQYHDNILFGLLKDEWDQIAR